MVHEDNTAEINLDNHVMLEIDDVAQKNACSNDDDPNGNVNLTQRVLHRC